MLIPRRFWRGRICRDCCHSMAAIMGLSALLCFYGSVFRVSTNPTGHLESENVASAQLSTNYGEYSEKYAANSVSLQRHNRALQFMGSKKFGGDVSDSELAIKHESNENSQETQVFSKIILLNERPGLVPVQTLDKNTHRNTNRMQSVTVASKNSNLQMAITSAKPELLTFPASGSIENNVVTVGTTTIRNLDLTNKENLEGKSSLLKDNKYGLYFNNSEVRSKKLPRAIIIGVKKAGTRALLEFLRLHPDVEGTGPEPHFFDRNYVKGLQWYREHMPETRKHQMTIEKTPGYFVTKDAPKRIYKMNPDIKLILVVRDPVTRAISDYCQAVSKHAMKPFEEMALLDEHLGLVNTSWGAIRIGVYAKHMEHWLQVFSLDQIHLVDGQKLIEEPALEVAKVEAFLDLPKYINQSHFYLRGFKGTFPCLIRDGKPHCLDEKSKGRSHPVVKESVLQRLRDFYRPFNAKFFQMVGRNFEWS